jgi:hypothetical protein
MNRATPPALASHAFAFLVAFAGGAGERDEKGTLAMSPAVACKAIEGYERFEPLPDATLTSDDKLLVYYRPTGFRIEHAGDQFRAHLVQDARIRRHGQKAVLQSKLKLLDYEARSDHPPARIYLRNTISLKALKPGHYDLDIILHDQIAGGSPVTQSLPFRIVAAPSPNLPPSGDGSKESAGDD